MLKNESHTASEEERAEAKESAEKPAEPRKTKAQLWNEIKIKCTLTLMNIRRKCG